jgi:hypothetical protein
VAQALGRGERIALVADRGAGGGANLGMVALQEHRRGELAAPFGAVVR